MAELAGSVRSKAKPQTRGSFVSPELEKSGLVSLRDIATKLQGKQG